MKPFSEQLGDSPNADDYDRALASKLSTASICISVCRTPLKRLSELRRTARFMKYLACLSLLLCLACREPESRQPASGTAADTTIATYNSIYRSRFDSSRCVSYTLSVGRRNTGFSCNVCQHLGGLFHGKVDILMQGQYSQPVSYRMELRYLQQLLPLIARRFPLDSLDCISLGSIADHPDLAVSLTEEYVRKFGSLGQQDPQSIDAFFDHSGVAQDFNRLLSPYSTGVKHVGVEKLSISAGTRKLLDRNALESDTAQIPDKVLDGTLYIYLRQE